MKDSEFYKVQLEDLIHFFRSPLVTLSLAEKTLIKIAVNNNSHPDLYKNEEYIESLDLIRSSIKKMNKYINNVDKKLLKKDKQR